MLLTTLGQSEDKDDISEKWREKMYHWGPLVIGEDGDANLLVDEEASLDREL
jgi:hypothetical protein